MLARFQDLFHFTVGQAVVDERFGSDAPFALAVPPPLTFDMLVFYRGRIARCVPGT